MQIRFVRRCAVAAVAATIAITLPACSGGSSDSGGGSTNTVDMSTPAPKGVTLTMWHNSGDSDALLNLYKAYEAESGNKLDLVDLPTDTYPTAVQTKYATGDRPDILEYPPSSQDMAQLNMSENMLDLSSLSFVKAEGDLNKVAGSLDGKTYGAVLGPLATFGVYFNKDVLKAAGVPVPTTYTQLQDTCAAIKATGKTPVFVGAGSEFPANMLAGFAYMAQYNKDDQYGLGVKNGTTKVNDPNGPIVGGLTAVDNLRKAGCLNDDAATATFQQAVAAVSKGSAAMTVLPSDFISQFYSAGSSQAAVDAKIGFGAISATQQVASYSAGSYGSYFAPKTKDATKERAAADFIDWVTTKGYQSYVTEAKSVPTLSTATAPKLTGMYASMQQMLTDPNSTTAFNSSIPGFGNFGKIAVSVVAGQVAPQKAADNFEVFVDQAIEAQKK